MNKNIQRILCLIVGIIVGLLIVKHAHCKEYQTAKCSWYGPGFHGKTIANGEKYDMYNSTTVAHKRLPFGTVVEFKHHDKVAYAVVKDRGPYVKGREFDLSKGLAAKLGVIGVSSVQYRIMYNNDRRIK